MEYNGIEIETVDVELIEGKAWVRVEDYLKLSEKQKAELLNDSEVYSKTGVTKIRYPVMRDDEEEIEVREMEMEIQVDLLTRKEREQLWRNRVHVLEIEKSELEERVQNLEDSVAFLNTFIGPLSLHLMEAEGEV